MVVMDGIIVMDGNMVVSSTCVFFQKHVHKWNAT